MEAYRLAAHGQNHMTESLPCVPVQDPGGDLGVCRLRAKLHHSEPFPFCRPGFAPDRARIPAWSLGLDQKHSRTGDIICVEDGLMSCCMAGNCQAIALHEDAHEGYASAVLKHDSEAELQIRAERNGRMSLLLLLI